jgi:hypothetical protein
MLMLQFKQTCCTELQFLAVQSVVIACLRTSIQSAKSIICRLSVMPTVLYISEPDWVNRPALGNYKV